MVGRSRNGTSPNSTSYSPPQGKAILKPSKTGYQKVTDIIQEGFCFQTVVFRLQVINKRELSNETYEFTFKAGKTTVRGVSFGKNGGPANNTKIEAGNTYDVRGLHKQILICLRNKQKYKQPGFTSKYELRLPELHVLSQKVNRPSKDSKSKLNNINQLNKLIDTAGKFYREGNLTNVTIDYCEFRRYKGCHACKTRIQDPVKNNKRLLCPKPKCRKEGRDKKEDGKWKMFMTLKDFRFRDEEGNTFEGGIAFHEECQKVLANFCDNYDEMFDEQAREVAKNNLIGAKVNVSIKIQSQIYREAGTRSTDLKIVVGRLKILSPPPPASENENQSENEPQPSTSRGGSVYTTSNPARIEPVEPMDEESARAVDYENTDSSHSTTTVAARRENDTVFTQSGTDSVNYGQPDQSDQSESESASDSEQYSPKSNSELWPDYDELKKNDQKFRLKKCGVMIVHIFTTEFDDGTYDERHGSEKDVHRLLDLFRDTLEVEVFDTFKDVKSTDLTDNLENYKQFLEEIDADSMMLFFSGHGKQNSITLSDGHNVNFYTDILSCFADKHFPHLAGKPKMFFPLGCQDFDDSDQNVDRNGFLALDYSATLVLLPQLSGNKVPRSKSTGTAFVKYFCDIVRKHSADCDVMELMKRTSAFVEAGVKDARKLLEDPEKMPNQAPQPQTIGFHAKYYFTTRRQGQTKLSVRIGDCENDNAVMDFSSA